MQKYYTKPQKDVGMVYLCWLTTFIFMAGTQNFYLGKPWKGILWMLTYGLLGMETLWDLFTLPSQVSKVNEQ